MYRSSILQEKDRANRKRRKLVVFLLFAIGFIFLVSDARAKGFPQVMFIVDASGSMWGDAGGQRKIDAAKEVISKIVPELPSEVKVGLTVYGHRRKGDCSDIEVMVPPGSSDRKGLIAKVLALSPKGKTPIADSIKKVANLLKSIEEETTIILISDGEETCNADPCGVVKSLKKAGIKFILHVVGFDVNDSQKKQLECLSEAGSGKYFGAKDTGSLLEAFETVKKEVSHKVEKAKTTAKKSVSRLGKLHITMPASSTRCLHVLKVEKASNGKTIKKIESIKPDSVHPLLAGKYKLTAGYANSNYKPDSVVSYGTIEVKGGETTVLKLGAIAVNIADSLKKMPAGAVIITKEGDNGFTLVTPYTGNSYYFYKTKPVPAGTYNFAVHYKGSYLYRTSTKPVILAKSVHVSEGRQSVVTIDSGIRITKPHESSMVSWKLIPAENKTDFIMIDSASNGDYPLWETYAVPPGTYDLVAFVKGMTEPLPAGEGLMINKGELLKFDTGL
ncbi:MAG TPA: hypothetical protein DDW42_08750 [Desulfobacteraceae bacterium]|nr:hypothetical protein [Desulfobacteraceae bacterium]